MNYPQRRLFKTTDPNERAQIEAQLQDNLDLLTSSIHVRARFTAVTPEQAAIAREGRTGKAGARHQALDVAIIEWTATHKAKLAISEQFADRVRTYLTKKLEYLPKTSTIKDAVRRVKRSALGEPNPK